MQLTVSVSPVQLPSFGRWGKMSYNSSMFGWKILFMKPMLGLL